MALQKMEVVFFMVMALYIVSISMATDYKVGDSAGWTLSEHVNYTHWAAHKKFHIGDTLVFAYDSTYHNVLIVDRHQFKACNETFPMSTYSSGYDSITLNQPGRFFFICGFPGHCQAGQKFHIKVTAAASIF